jgi:hypothetical protein
MARRNENECAHCAEEIGLSQRVVGKDWKVYCSNQCAQAGEMFSQIEQQQWLNFVRDRRADECDIEISAAQLQVACGLQAPISGR